MTMHARRCTEGCALSTDIKTCPAQAQPHLSSGRGLAFEPDWAQTTQLRTHLQVDFLRSQTLTRLFAQLTPFVKSTSCHLVSAPPPYTPLLTSPPPLNPTPANGGSRHKVEARPGVRAPPSALSTAGCFRMVYMPTAIVSSCPLHSSWIRVACVTLSTQQLRLTLPGICICHCCVCVLIQHSSVWRAGYRAAGDANLLQELGLQYGLRGPNRRAATSPGRGPRVVFVPERSAIASLRSGEAHHQHHRAPLLACGYETRSLNGCPASGDPGAPQPPIFFGYCGCTVRFRRRRVSSDGIRWERALTLQPGHSSL
jgi:hypothetical protein